MLVAELQELEEVKNLVTKGQQLGVLTFGEVATAVSEVELDESDIEELYGHLERSGHRAGRGRRPRPGLPPDPERADRQARRQAPEVRRST